jgi:hypothetical protein
MKTILKLINSLSKRKSVYPITNMDFTVDHARFNAFISIP